MYKCYNCKEVLPAQDSQSWFCNDECKNKYWSKESKNVKISHPKTLDGVIIGLTELKKRAERREALDNITTYEDAKEIFI